MMRPLLATSLLLVACAHSPDVVQRTSTDGIYRQIEFDGAFDIDIEVGPKAAVELSGPRRAIERVEVGVEGEQLTISMEDHRVRNTRGGIHVQITTPQLERIELNGAATLDISGMQAGALAVELNGAGSTRARGTVTQFDLEINGAGSVEATELVAEHVNVDLSGTGRAEVHATRQLHAELDGMGSIRYAGQPTVVDKQVNGIGTIRPQ